MANKERVAQLASYLWWACSALIYLLPVVTLAVIVTAMRSPDWPRSLFPEVAAGPPGWVENLLVAALALVLLLPVLHLLIEMRDLFANYRRGDVLTQRSARHILVIGRAMVSLAILKVVVPTLQILLLSGGHVVALNLNDTFMILLLAGGFLVTVGWAMREAADLAEENRGFV